MHLSNKIHGQFTEINQITQRAFNMKLNCSETAFLYLLRRKCEQRCCLIIQEEQVRDLQHLSQTLSQRQRHFSSVVTFYFGYHSWISPWCYQFQTTKAWLGWRQNESYINLTKICSHASGSVSLYFCTAVLWAEHFCKQANFPLIICRYNFYFIVIIIVVWCGSMLTFTCWHWSSTEANGMSFFAGFSGQVITIRPESVMDVCTKCHCNASNSCQDI